MNLGRSTMHPKFDPTGVQTHDCYQLDLQSEDFKLSDDV